MNNTEFISLTLDPSSIREGPEPNQVIITYRDRVIINYEHNILTKINSQQTKTYKYRFINSKSSKYICPICFENFKPNDIMCINSCFHYWCNSCESQFKTLTCPICRKDLELNVFFESKGKIIGEFKNLHCCIEPIDIIKEDLEFNNDLSNLDEDNELIDESDYDYINSKVKLDSIE